MRHGQFALKPHTGLLSPSFSQFLYPQNYALRLAFLAALALACFMTHPAQAADTPTPLSTTELKRAAENSPQVFIGRVVSTKAKWSGRVIVTESQVEPMSVLKGTLSDNYVKITTVGGTVNNIRLSAAHVPEIQQGELALFFVKDASGKSELMRDTKVFAVEKGKIQIKAQAPSKRAFEQDVRLQETIRSLRATIE